MLDAETLLRDLKDLSLAISDLEAELNPLRRRRDRLIVRACEMKIPELKIAAVSGKKRGWIWKLKIKHGLVTPGESGRYDKRKASGSSRKNR